MPFNHEVTVKAAPFAAAVAWAAKWRAARPAVPVHAGLLIETDDESRLTISAFNGEVAARITIYAEGLSAPGKAIVSGNLIAALAGTLPPKGEVTLASTDNGALSMKLGRWSASLPTFPEDDWPTMPATPDTIGTVSGDALAAAVARVGVAGGDDPKASAVFILMHLGFGDGLTLTATNRYRVAQTRVPWTRVRWTLADQPVGPGMPDSATPIGSTLVAAAGAFAGPGDVAIGCDGNVLGLTGSSRSLVMTTGDPGEAGWPIEPLNTQLNKALSNEGAVQLRPADLVGPVKRAAIVRGKGGPVRLQFTEGLLTIASSETDLKQDGSEELEIAYTGPAASFAINPDYLSDALNSAPGDTVTMRFKVEESTRIPIAVVCAGDQNWRHIVVPVVQL